MLYSNEGMRRILVIVFGIFMSQQRGTTGLVVTVPDEYTTYELGVINITCVAGNTVADVEYKWTFAGNPEFEEEGSELYIELVRVDDAGYYTCEARTVEAVPEVGYGTTEVVVWYTPRWEVGAVQKFAADVGETGMVICKVNAFPTPGFYWQHPLGQNLTGGPDYTIISDGEVSTVEFNAVKSSDYGTYHCFSHNQIATGKFDLELLAPQIPDAPTQCQTRNLSSSTAELHCIPGFDGGAELNFPVYKRTSVTDPQRTETAEEWIHTELVLITVKGLSGNTSYSLSIFGENKYGRSDESYGVDIITKPGPGADDGKDFPIVAVACGAAVGFLLVVGIVVCVLCILCRRADKQDEPTTGFTDPKNTQNYVTEEDVNPSTVGMKRQSAGRSSWGSFKRKKNLWKPGVDNPTYASSTENVASPSHSSGNPPRVASYSDSIRPYAVGLNHNPGESADSFDNPGYSNDSMETSFNSGVSPAMPVSSWTQGQPPASRYPEVSYRRQMSNPYDRAKRMTQDQPGLAGSGALQNISMPGTIPNIAPLTPKLQNDRRISLSVRPQTFVPEVHWEFPREKLYIRKKLGEGSFGEVWRARAEGILGRKGKILVAVKMLKQQYTPEERRTLLKELEIMKMLQPHPNIIQLLGCCMQSEPLSIIMEYAANGNLQDALRNQRNTFEMNDLNRENSRSGGQTLPSLTARDLMIFALHVASGMDYIESKELLHRDLAARNILVDEQMVCKICDFGSARDVVEMREYESRTQRRLPLRWMAPESLFNCQYSTKSDVWSFGVLLWEIVTLGSSPYPGMSGPEVMEFVQKGCRMQKPAHCTDTVYAIMKDCWSHYPIKRPSFSILRHRLVAILDDPDYDMFIDQMEDNVYAIMKQQPGEKC